MISQIKLERLFKKTAQDGIDGFNQFMHNELGCIESKKERDSVKRAWARDLLKLSKKKKHDDIKLATEIADANTQHDLDYFILRMPGYHETITVISSMNWILQDIKPSRKRDPEKPSEPQIAFILIIAAINKEIPEDYVTSGDSSGHDFVKKTFGVNRAKRSTEKAKQYYSFLESWINDGARPNPKIPELRQALKSWGKYEMKTYDKAKKHYNKFFPESEWIDLPGRSLEDLS